MPRRNPGPRQVAFVEPNPAAEPQTVPARRPLRVREQQWTNLHTTTARLDPGTDERLTHANKLTGQNPQQIWEEALNFFADQNGVPEEMPPNAELKLPLPAGHRPAGHGLVKVAVRLTTNTRARLVAVATSLGLGGSECITEALNAWFDEIGIPGTYDPGRNAKPTLYTTGARLDDALRERVKTAAQRIGTTQKGVWEAAINAYADRHDVPKEMPEEAAVDLPTPSRHPVARGGPKPVQVRLERNTRARLVEACVRQSRTGGEVIVDALNEYCDHLGIPGPDDGKQ